MQANLKSAIDKGTENMKKFMNNFADTSNEYVSIPNASILGGNDGNEISYGIRTAFKEVTNNISDIVREDPYSHRTRIIICGIIMVMVSMFDFIFNFFTFSTHDMFISLYSLLFGIIICIFNGEVFCLNSRWIVKFKYLAKCFDYIFAKGTFMLLVGFFQYIERKSFLDAFSGGWCMFVGATCMVVGTSAGKKLTGLHVMYRNLGELKNDFTIFDADEDGLLSGADFSNLCQSKGILMTDREVEACFHYMLNYDTGMISKDHFTSWYESWDEIEDSA